MLLVGPRVRLEPLTPADVPLLVAWDRDLENLRAQGSDLAVPQSVEAAAARLARDDARDDTFVFGIRTLHDDTLVGAIRITGIAWQHRHGGLGVSIAREHQGAGLGTEAMELILAFAFDELNLHRVELGVFSYNTGAIRLYERLGFVHEGRFRQWGRRDGAWFDLVNMALLETEYRGR